MLKKNENIHNYVLGLGVFKQKYCSFLYETSWSEPHKQLQERTHFTIILSWYNIEFKTFNTYFTQSANTIQDKLAMSINSMNTGIIMNCMNIPM